MTLRSAVFSLMYLPLPLYPPAMISSLVSLRGDVRAAEPGPSTEGGCSGATGLPSFGERDSDQDDGDSHHLQQPQSLAQPEPGGECADDHIEPARDRGEGHRQPPERMDHQGLRRLGREGKCRQKNPALARRRQKGPLVDECHPWVTAAIAPRPVGGAAGLARSS